MDYSDDKIARTKVASIAKKLATLQESALTTKIPISKETIGQVILTEKGETIGKDNMVEITEIESEVIDTECKDREMNEAIVENTNTEDEDHLPVRLVLTAKNIDIVETIVQTQDLEAMKEEDMEPHVIGITMKEKDLEITAEPSLVEEEKAHTQGLTHPLVDDMISQYY